MWNQQEKRGGNYGMQACNRRYLGFISQWPDRTAERHRLCELSAPARDEKERSHRA